MLSSTHRLTPLPILNVFCSRTKLWSDGWSIPFANFLVATAVSLDSPFCAVGQTPTTTVLYSFDGTDGAYPEAALLQDDNGNLLGTTARGGEQQSSGTNSTLFTVSAGNVLTTLHLFKGHRAKNPDKSDGSSPQGTLVLGTDGNFYSTTTYGGLVGDGTLFVITPVGEPTLLHSFSQVSSTGINSDGAFPQSGLSLGTDGNFYGTTVQGGEYRNGVVFCLTPAGVLTILHSFNGGDGANAESPPIQGSDGNLYGTTNAGGGGNQGVVYKLTPGGTLTVLHSFNGLGDDGVNPFAALVQGTDGNFYGATSAGGSNGAGTVFSVTRDGVLTTLYNFDGENDGQDPQGVLLQASDGNFYGTTYGNAASVASGGTLFKITPAGVLTTMHTFGLDKDGASPEAGLIQGKDGNLYGTTSLGGDYGMGTVYRVNLVPLPEVTATATVPTVSVGSGGEGVFTLHLPIALTSDVIVNYSLKGSAVNGTDYEFLSGSKTIKAGETDRSIKVVPQGNQGGQNEKTVKLVLEPGMGYNAGDTSAVKITILP